MAGTLGAMKTSPFLLRFAGGAVLALCAGVSVIASADGPSQPDPPVPAELVMQHPLGVSTSAVEREPDCRCAVLHARDIESRIEGHVALWQSMPRTPADAERERTATQAVPFRLTAFIEGVVGFPMRHYRLAVDDNAYGEH
jgi:hypothetical protein